MRSMAQHYAVWLPSQVGPRLKSDRERFSPNNILLMIAGGGLLWMGWSGFNGGAPYAANITAAVAVLNTNVSAATSLLTWTCLDVIFFGKPSVIGAVQGMMTGLVCITPGAGTYSSTEHLLGRKCVVRINHMNQFVTMAS